MNNNKKLFLTILGVLLSAILVTGITFAGWEWASGSGNDTNITFTTEKDFSCSADGGGNITEADVKLVPTTCDNSEYVIKREITTNVVNNSGTPINLDLWLDIKKLSQGLSDSHNFRYVVTTSGDSCGKGSIITQGTFNGKEVDDKVYLLKNNIYQIGATRTYYLYMWLDYNGIDRTTQEEEFTLELNGECADSVSSNIVYEANKPYVYNTGLIPVKLSDTGSTVTTVSEDDPTWYSYDDTNKVWANAVLVTETNREKYKNYPGTVVSDDDILAYYVWIPRYSYKVWRLTGASSNSENHSIDIKFIPTYVIDEVPTETGKYYTHPAFWWDDDSDGIREVGEELSGIWVGKFETSNILGSASLGTDSGTTICNSTSCNNYIYLRVLPNVKSLRHNRISNFFNASRFMDSVGNPFGIVVNRADSHMIKNSEWGAVAYLSRSKYGKNSEVRINNQNTFTTGCGAATVNASAAGDCSNKYADVVTTFPQSTNGNVTGIFDMSGGADDYVMAHWGGTTNYGKSGFSSTYQLPPAKYYDNYPQTPFNGNLSTNYTYCTLEYCGGHALNETKNWYSDASEMVNSANFWFFRGGTYRDQSSAGVFRSYTYNNGDADSFYSFRLVLIQNYENIT